jgi:ribosomal protein L11 methyltransferase
MQNYYELYVYGVKNFEEDLVSSFLFDLGASGVSQKLDFIQTAENFDPKVLDKPITDLVAYFDQPVELEHFLILKNYCDNYEIKVELQKDWISEWKKHYHPLEIVPEFWVVPEWITFDAPIEKQVRISPGLAFGTGTHPTTQLMAELISDVLSKESHDEFLDLGAGTGILSILMYLKGVKSGVATEIDPMARDKCIENLEINKITSILVADETFLTNLNNKYSLVVANIIDGVLINLREEISRSFSKTLIVSGILDERNELFNREFIQKMNLKIISSRQKDIWWGYVLKA